MPEWNKFNHYIKHGLCNDINFRAQAYNENHQTLRSNLIKPSALYFHTMNFR